MEMHGGGTRSDVRPVVSAGDRVYRVLPKIAFLRGERDHLAGGFLKGGLIKTYGAVDIKNDAARVLANGLRFVARQRDILVDNLHRALGDGALLFLLERSEDGLVHVFGDFRGRSANQFEQRIGQQIHAMTKLNTDASQVNVKCRFSSSFEQNPAVSLELIGL